MLRCIITVYLGYLRYDNQTITPPKLICLSFSIFFFFFRLIMTKHMEKQLLLP